MKAIMIVKIVFICMVVILPSTLCGYADDKLFEHTKRYLDNMVKKNESINNAIQLTKNGYLGRGAYGLSYKGKLMGNPTEYAIKITFPMYLAYAQKEFDMYTYLRAVNRTETEAFGIPVIYYYEMWKVEENLAVLAMTLLDPEFGSSVKKTMENKQFEPLDILIIFREFVKISKYIHGRGIRHNDIKLDNMMFRANQGFIIDFNLATRMGEKTHSGTLTYLPRRAHRSANGAQYPIDDWESFLYSMCELVKIELEWFDRRTQREMDTAQRDEFIYKHKMNISKTMDKIENFKCKGLKTVFVNFAKHVFNRAATIPPYDDVYDMIHTEIKSSIRADKAVVASWVRDRKRHNAMIEYRANPYFNISTIPGP